MDNQRRNDGAYPASVLSGAVDAALAGLRRRFGQFDHAGFQRALANMPEAFVFCPEAARAWTEADEVACLVSGAAAFAVASGKRTVVEGHAGHLLVLLAGSEQDALAAIERAAARVPRRRRR
jgi:hypothetical protein